VDDKERQFVDELLDASLRNYAAGEPRAGLEGRALATIRARQQAARRRTAWWWAAGLAGAAAMATLLAITLAHRPPAPLPAIAKAPVSPSAPVVSGVVVGTRPPVLRRVQGLAVPAAPDWRPQQFPTPRPLSEQEKLLVAYVQALRASTAATAPNTGQDVEAGQAIPPLSIAAIKIEPLAPEEEGDGK
jgi:hypothetical protein